MSWVKSVADPSGVWSPRENHAVVASDANTIVLMGGYDDKNQNMNDVYKSNDVNGKWSKWIKVLVSAPWDGRGGHAAILVGNSIIGSSIIIFGGSQVSQTISYGDVWVSVTDLTTSDVGLKWVAGSLNINTFTSRSSHNVLMSGSNIILSGGKAGGTYFNEMWSTNINCIPGYYCSEVGGSPKPCAAGTYCPTNTIFPIKCVTGSYCPSKSAGEVI